MKQNTTNLRERIDERAPIRERWTGHAPGQGDEAIAGALLRSAAAGRPFGAKELAEVGARLRVKERYRPRPLAWQIAIAACLICLGSVLSASVSHVWRATHGGAGKGDASARSTENVPAKKPIRRASPAAVRPPTEEVAPLAALPPPESPEPSALSSEGRPPVVHANRRVAVREALASKKAEPEVAALPPDLQPAPQPPPGPSSLAQESRLLASAIAKLRQDDDAKQALAILDRYREQFGSKSALAPEEAATRIEALLRMERHGQALALLDAQTPTTTGVGREMLIARAELRADRGRRRAALHDFDLLIAAGVKPDSVSERALYGRAACRGKIGDWEGARGDFRMYLATFPNGKLAGKARAALGQDLR